MADCPGVLHLAAMADGALARVRTPGGRLSAAQARAVAEAAWRLGSGKIDLTNRANLQIRGLAPDAGPALAKALIAACLPVEGSSDRRRNILLDPYSGLDPAEVHDMRPLAAVLDEALRNAAWIGGLSPKFSFALDGGGRAQIGGVASDVVALAREDGILVGFGANAVEASIDDAPQLLAAIAEATARLGPDARARDLPFDATLGGFGAVVHVRRAADALRQRRSAPRFGAVPTVDADRVALTFPVPVGRLDPAMLGWLADLAEAEGDGSIVLAPWSAAVAPRVKSESAERLLKRSEREGFTPVAVATRLRVVACAGAPACPRAHEPAKALGRALLALAAERPARLPESPASVHFSACSKGCAGSAAADLLALGRPDEGGWTVHRDAAPRAPGPAVASLDRAEAPRILDLLARVR